MTSENSTPAIPQPSIQMQLNEQVCDLHDTAALLESAEESLWSHFEMEPEGNPKAASAMRAASVLRVAAGRLKASAERLAEIEQQA